jgi:hypothetical protein
MQFDGVNDFAEVTGLGLGAPTEFTVMGWVRLGSIAATPYLFDSRVGALNGYEIVVVSSTFFVAASGSARVLYVGIGPTLVVGTRYHIALRVTAANSLTVYIDGALAFTATLGATNQPTSFTRMRFGADSAGGSPLNGVLANWSAYQRALSVAEIRAAARRKRGALFLPNTENLVAHYPLTAVSGATTQDVSGNGRNLTLTNMVANPIVAF